MVLSLCVAPLSPSGVRVGIDASRRHCNRCARLAVPRPRTLRHPVAPSPRQFGEVGDAFDPHVHEALYEYEDETKEAGTIGQLVKEGYMFNERCLRPAQAGTVRAPVS